MPLSTQAKASWRTEEQAAELREALHRIQRDAAARGSVHPLKKRNRRKGRHKV